MRCCALLLLLLTATPCYCQDSGFFQLSLTDNLMAFDITAVDPMTLLPIPNTFTADPSGNYSVEALMVVDGNTAEPVGSFRITGRNLAAGLDLETDFVRPLLAGGESTSTLFLSIISGIDVISFSPGSELSIDANQNVEIIGSAGTPPASALVSSRTFLATPDAKETPATDLSEFAPIPGVSSLDVNGAEIPDIPMDSMETVFSQVLTQQDLALFDIPQNADFSVSIHSGISIAPPTLPGDANGDGVVDLLDLDTLGANFGAMTANGPADGDFNNDGVVDLLDLDILGGNFGESLPSASVPEPAAAALLLGACACMRRRGAALHAH